MSTKNILSMGTVFQHSGKKWYFSKIWHMAVFSNHLDGEERAGCFVLLVSSDCCVALPHGSMGLSAVCDCGSS